MGPPPLAKPLLNGRLSMRFQVPLTVSNSVSRDLSAGVVRLLQPACDTRPFVAQPVTCGGLKSGIEHSALQTTAATHLSGRARQRNALRPVRRQRVAMRLVAAVARARRRIAARHVRIARHIARCTESSRWV